MFDDTHTVDVVSDIEGEMADIPFVLSCVDVVYRVCNVMNVVDEMCSLQWCELLEWI